MNGSLVMMGVVAAMSIVFFSYVAYHLGSLVDDITLSDSLLRDNSSLEEDFKDILGFVPMTEVRSIINNYLKYDSQIDDTVCFIEDQKRFIAREFQRIPQFNCLVNLLRANGLEVDNWITKIQSFWKTRATFVKSDLSMATGGLTVMIQRILNTIPKDELHEFLHQKAKYSASFRRFLQILKSGNFLDLCDAIDKNVVLQRHLFWAKQAGIEVTFAVELLRNLYIYSTEEIW